MVQYDYRAIIGMMHRREEEEVTMHSERAEEGDEKVREREERARAVEDLQPMRPMLPRGRHISNVFMQPASQVLPFLYVGSQANAADKKLLRSLKIEKLLCVKEMNYAPDPEGIDLMFIPMSDDGSTSLDSVLSQCFDFIKKSRELEKGLLVYCRGGVNRSPTVVLAFLMRSEMMTLKESFDLLKKVRPQITPCLAYIRQLLEIERRLFGKVTLNESEQPRLLSLEERVERWRKQKERRSSTGSGSKGFLQSVREVFHW